MKSREAGVLEQSDYYVYTPSQTARDLFFYPLYTGRFFYSPNYRLFRKSYDSFLLMYIESGSMELTYNGRTQVAKAGDFLFIDCYEEHGYRALEGWSCLWLHFDGAQARAYYTSIVERHSNIFSLDNGYPILAKLDLIFRTFNNGHVVREAMMSKYIYDILTSFFLHGSGTNMTENGQNQLTLQADMAEVSMMYMNDNFHLPLTVDELAVSAGMSTYHFIRSFKRAAGITPYQYLIHTRLNAAKYLLINSNLSIKEICFSTGFTSESVFSHRFKRQIGITPGQYRQFASSS